MTRSNAQFRRTIAIASLVFFHTTALQSQSKKVEVWTFDQLQSFIDDDEDRLKVINFWATWCAPCIKELPYFDNISKTHPEINMLLVSLDFADQIDTKVMPFVERKGIVSKVVILGDENYNEWIDKISTAWSGALPATLFVAQDGRQHFHEGELSEERLMAQIEDFSTK